MKKGLVVAAVLFLAAGILGGTAVWVAASGGGDKAPRQVDFYASDAGKEVEVEVGSLLTVTLESNVTTGFQWQLAENSDDTVLELVGNEYEDPDEAGSEAVGASGEEVWKFKAVEKGKGTLVLEYNQPWPGGMKADKSFTLTVVVK